MNPQNRFSRPSLVAFFGLAGFVVAGLLLWLGSVLTGVLPLALGNIWVHLPMLMGSDLMFLIVWFILWIVIGILVGMRMTRHRAQAVSAALLSERTGSRGKRSFTLIELLIVIAIIAVLAVVVILALNPAQLLAAARDSNRVSDLHTLNQALTLYSEDVGTGMGASSVVYMSIPDPSATSTLGDQCQGLGLASSSLPTGWSWHCAASSTYKDVNGEGWVPVDFRKMSSGSPMGSLPVDPVNTTSTGLYYTYTVNGDPWELTANMESQKYQMGGSNDVVSKDGGQYPDLYEVGTDLALMPIDYNPSLVGYWKLDEGSGTVAFDSSGHGNNGTWGGTEAGTSGYYSQGPNQSYVGNFDGSNNYVEIPYSSAYDFKNGFSFSFWFEIMGALNANNLALGSNAIVNSGCEGWSIPMPSSTPAYWTIYGSSGGAQYAFYPPTSTWAFAALSVNMNNNTMTVYINGAKIGQGGLRSGSSLGTVNPSCSGSNVPIFIGTRTPQDSFFDGLIANVQMYNRALSASEIQAIYNAEK